MRRVKQAPAYDARSGKVESLYVGLHGALLLMLSTMSECS